MNIHVNAISNRLSLRQPQRDALEILARVCEIAPIEKDAEALIAHHALLPQLGDAFCHECTGDDRHCPM